MPATRDGMWALMQSLDATTEAGREQIATLLRLSGTADAYYTMLERNQDELAQALEAQVQALREQNKALRRKVISTATAPPDPHAGAVDGQPLRRTRTTLM